MPKLLTQYRVFIGSPSGLDEERKCFRLKLETYTALHCEPRGVAFHPVRWEETVGGAGRPQELINKDLSQCDYAVFVLHDRWGSPPGSRYTSGFEEEWALAQELYEAKKIRNMALFFKKVEPRRMLDPGKQLRMVLSFKKRIEAERRYLFAQYDTIEQFVEVLEGYLAGWQRDHEGTTTGLSIGESGVTDGGALSAAGLPGFDYWIAEAIDQLNDDVPNYAGALFCARKATGSARSDIEWAYSKNVSGVVLSHLGKLGEAISAFTEVGERFLSSSDVDRLGWLAKALVNKGITLGTLDRTEEAIAVYNDLLARFGSAPELPLREHVAKALVNKGDALDHGEEAIAVYNDLLARFGSAPELPLREQVAKALVNKGITLNSLDRPEEAIAVYNDLLARFGSATELPLREQVAKALVNKGDALDHSEEAIAVYNDLLARFGSATELPLREQVAKALVNKGNTLDTLDRSEEAIAAYNDLLARFGSATELPLREQVVIVIGKAMSDLNDRERHILTERCLRRYPTTLEDLSEQYGISPARVRQIEMRAFKKVQKVIKLDRVFPPIGAA